MNIYCSCSEPQIRTSYTSLNLVYYHGYYCVSEVYHTILWLWKVRSYPEVIVFWLLSVQFYLYVFARNIRCFSRMLIIVIWKYCMYWEIFNFCIEWMFWTLHCCDQADLTDRYLYPRLTSKAEHLSSKYIWETWRQLSTKMTSPENWLLPLQGFQVSKVKLVIVSPQKYNSNVPVSAWATVG